MHLLNSVPTVVPAPLSSGNFTLPRGNMNSTTRIATATGVQMTPAVVLSNNAAALPTIAPTKSSNIFASSVPTGTLFMSKYQPQVHQRSISCEMGGLVGPQHNPSSANLIPNNVPGYPTSSLIHLGSSTVYHLPSSHSQLTGALSVANYAPMLVSEPHYSNFQTQGYPSTNMTSTRPPLHSTTDYSQIHPGQMNYMGLASGMPVERASSDSGMWVSTSCASFPPIGLHSQQTYLPCVQQGSNTFSRNVNSGPPTAGVPVNIGVSGNMEVAAVAYLRQELAIVNEKLNSCSQSIKTFWSPELTRERTLRKEEMQKCALLSEHCRQLQLEKQNLLARVHDLECTFARENHTLRRRCIELEREARILAVQKADLSARLGEEMPNLKRAGADELQQHNQQLEVRIIDKETEVELLKQDLINQKNEMDLLRSQMHLLEKENRQVHTLHSLLETKDSKVATLESEIRLLEGELTKHREDELSTSTVPHMLNIGNPAFMVDGSCAGNMGEEWQRAFTMVRNNERSLKSKIENLSQEVAQRECDMYTLKSKLEMAEQRCQDHEHRVEVLREQLSAKDNKVESLASEMEDLRKRLREREKVLEKRGKMATDVSTEKRLLEAQVDELKAENEAKEKKLANLRCTIDTLESSVSEKEGQLAGLKSRVASLQNERSNFEEARNALEDCLRERDRQIEKMKEQRQRSETDHKETLESLERIISEQRTRFESQQRELSNLRQYKDKGLQNEHEMALKNDEIANLKNLLDKIGDPQATARSQISEIDNKLAEARNETAQLRNEQARLRMALSEMERSCLTKDQTIKNLEENMEESKRKISSLRQASQMEANRRMNSVSEEEHEGLKKIVEEKTRRIIDLERALNEAMNAMNEISMNELDELRHQSEAHRRKADSLSRERDLLKMQYNSLQEEMEEKEAQLQTLETECFQGYLPEMERLRQLSLEMNSKYEAVIGILRNHYSRMSPQEQNIVDNVSTSSMNISATPASTCIQSSTVTAERLNRLVQEKETMIKKLKEDMQQLSQTNKTLDQQLKETSSELAKLQAKNESLQRGNNVSSTLDALKRENAELLEQLEITSRQLRDSRGQLEDIDRYEAEIEMLRGEISFKEDEITNLKEEMSEMQRAYVDIQANTQELLKQMEVVESAETHKQKLSQEMVAINNKYQIIVKQMTEKNEKIKTLESQCSVLHDKVEERKTVEMENIEMKQRVESLQRILSERDTTIRQLEQELTSCKEESITLSSQLQEYEADINRMRKEASSRDDRIKEIHNNHSNEINRLKKLRDEWELTNHQLKGQVELLSSEQSRTSGEQERLKQRIQTLEQERDRLGAEITLKEEQSSALKAEYLRAQNDELNRHQRAMDEANNRLTLLQKRIEEREGRLRKLEEENQTLLDEIHSLRKRNHELESQVDILRSQTMDNKGSNNTGYVSHVTSSSGAHTELDRLRRQCSETSSTMLGVQRSLHEAQIKCDQFRIERDKLRNELNAERRKVEDLEMLQTRDSSLMTKVEELQQELYIQRGLNEKLTKQLDSDKFTRMNSSGDLNSKTKDCEKRLKQALIQIENYQKTCDELQAEVQRLTQERDNLLNEQRMLDECAREVRHSITESDYLSSSKPGRRKPRTNDLSELHRQLSLRDQQIEMLEQEIYSLKSQMTQTPGMKITAPSSENNNVKRLQEEIRGLQRALQEKDEHIHVLETQCFQGQAQEIENLRHELHSQQRRAQNAVQRSQSYQEIEQKLHECKMELDSCRQELTLKTEHFDKFAAECNEKHLRHINRLEEDVNHLRQENEQLRRSLDETERLLKSKEEHVSQSVDVDNVRKELKRCQDEIANLKREAAVRSKQMDQQMVDILAMKQEALTASLCEKEANIALLEMTGAKNAHARQTLENLRQERGNVQAQLTQLSQTISAMNEEHKRIHGEK